MGTDEPRSALVEGVADLAFVEHALDELERVAAANVLTASDGSLFTLAVAEVLTNIAQHTPGEPAPISVRIEVSRDQIEAIIIDGAPAVHLDMDGATMPDVEAESGRGLALAREALDHLAVRYDGGNVWTLVRRLNRSDA